MLHITHSEKIQESNQSRGLKWPMVSREKKREEFTWKKVGFNLNNYNTNQKNEKTVREINN